MVSASTCDVGQLYASEVWCIMALSKINLLLSLAYQHKACRHEDIKKMKQRIASS